MTMICGYGGMADTRDLGIASALVGAAPTILTKNPSEKSMRVQVSLPAPLTLASH